MLGKRTLTARTLSRTGPTHEVVLNIWRSDLALWEVWVGRNLVGTVRQGELGWIAHLLQPKETVIGHRYSQRQSATLAVAQTWKLETITL